MKIWKKIGVSEERKTENACDSVFLTERIENGVREFRFNAVVFARFRLNLCGKAGGKSCERTIDESSVPSSEGAGGLGGKNVNEHIQCPEQGRRWCCTKIGPDQSHHTDVIVFTAIKRWHE